jgi:pimeloyl-ACP methyl ester carboxylesterase
MNKICGQGSGLFISWHSPLGIKSVFLSFFAVAGLGLLVRGEAEEKAWEADLPYRQEEVLIWNGGIKLAGTLTRPKTGKPFGAVVLIPGSGPVNRDEEVFGWKPFRVLADHLTRSGLAALRFDSRGVGGSGGTAYQYGLQDVAADVFAAVRYLKSRADIDHRWIGLCGHSQGGIVAPLCAAQSDDVSFVICLSGTGLPGDLVFFAQQRAISRAEGVTEREWQEDLGKLRKFVSLIRGQAARADLDPVVRAMVSNQIQRQTRGTDSPGEKRSSELESKVDCILSGYDTPWFRSFLDYDPRPKLAKVKCPVLLIFGEFDAQVPPEENRRAMVQSLLHGKHSDFTVKTFPGANHLFQAAVTGSPAEYERLGKEFVPGFLDFISSWISERVRKQCP